MKTTVIAFKLLLEACLIWSCAYDNTNKCEFQSEGTITAFDPRVCACCGGLLININNTYYDFTLPENSGLDLTNVTLPIKVSVRWSPDKYTCGSRIVVCDIRIKS